ncbi:MAG: 30S ribosomal protein S8, partial [Candidatus Moranbacteria bacterium GW2011_GWE2_47_10]
IRRVSREGQRIYAKKSEIKSVKNGYGFSVVSTSRGVMTGESARKNGLGGEVICEVW